MALKLIQGDCLEKLKEIEAEMIHALVTDPPAGISFMGKDWDGDKGGRKEWCAWLESVMSECLRVMKPGAHGLIWALPRTSHWTATALEDAGFEIRDVVTHLFGQGFPKSLNISKAIDKAAGAERDVVETIPDRWTGKSNALNFSTDRPQSEVKVLGGPRTEDAKQWQGWGTALKPASEHWILVRKPCSEKTVAANTLKHGTGGINIDGSRIPGISNDPNARANKASGKADATNTFSHRAEGEWTAVQGRFPANLVFSHSIHCTDDQCDIECAISMLDEQSGTLKSGAKSGVMGKLGYHGGASGTVVNQEANTGGASRFFYCAKISASERNAGLEGMPDKDGGCLEGNADRINARKIGARPDLPPAAVKNHHPTVKPQKLMRYLIKLITPPGGTVLDPFMGSGSTGLAAAFEGFDFIGIERQPDYFEISEKRIFNNFPEVIKQTYTTAAGALANKNE